MHVILTGATGLVGASMAEGHEKAKVIIHKDYKTYEKALLDELKHAHGCVWAQGISQNDVCKEEYVEITHDYPLAAAKAFSTLHPDSPFSFVYVSGEGATQNPGMFTPIYGRVKGETETALLEFGKQNPMLKVYNVRPGCVDWTSHPEIQAFMSKQALYKKTLIPALEVVYKPLMTPTRPLGRIMMDLAMSQGEPLQGSGMEMDGRLIRNAAIRRIAGL